MLIKKIGCFILATGLVTSSQAMNNNVVDTISDAKAEDLADSILAQLTTGKPPVEPTASKSALPRATSSKPSHLNIKIISCERHPKGHAVGLLSKPLNCEKRCDV
jgi:hypothetical protein